MSALAFGPQADDAVRRRLLWAMPTGIYVLGATGGAGGPYNLMTHSLAVQVATDPCVVAVAIDVTAKTHGLVAATGVCALSVLRRDDRALVRRFVKPVDDVAMDDGVPVTMAGETVALSPAGAPYLRGALGCLELRVVSSVPFASHTLYCCEVSAAAADPAVLEGPASARTAEVLRMEDTKMNYGG